MPSRIMAAVWGAVVGIAAWGVAANAAEPADVTVEVHGLRIVKPTPGGNQKMRAFNWSPGTTVALLLTVPGGGLLGLDPDASRVKAIMDDKGKDLSKPDVPSKFGGNTPKFGMMPTVSEDGKLCSAELTAPGSPTKGATQLTIAAEVALWVATQKKDFTAEKVALKPGATISAGPIPFTIKSAGKPEWGDAALSVAIQAKKKLDDIADIQFFDAQDKKVDANRGQTESMGFGDRVTVTWTYALSRKVDSAKIVVSYWTDKHQVTVPLRMTVGMGL
ncbi:MAG: hypothetical protein JXR37_01435 [Kiritimatiellae bacterium]|nr:hypothetical protein [Kiritimatiellia bacterium]